MERKTYLSALWQLHASELSAVEASEQTSKPWTFERIMASIRTRSHGKKSLRGSQRNSSAAVIIKGGTKRKTKLLTITLAVITAFSLTAAYAPQTSAKGLDACKVTENDAEFFVSATEKFIKLRKGTALSWTNAEMHQGVIVVRAKVGRKWIRGEIKIDATSCQ